jgi:hypothetical protein
MAGQVDGLLEVEVEGLGVTMDFPLGQVEMVQMDLQ